MGASEAHGSDTAHERARLARALFAPERVVLIGASTSPEKLTSRPLRVLQHHGYAGVVESLHASPVTHDSNPARAEGSALQAADHALIMTPATSVIGAIEHCGTAGIGVATVLSAGFAELGPRGRRRQDALLAAARRAGVRILGPNSLGLVNVAGRVALSGNAVFERETLRPGNVSLVSQSGSMLGAIVTRAQARGIGFSKLVAVGNESDISTGELVDLLVDDPDTGVILLFLEALRDAPQLGAAAQRAFAAGKPVIAYKLGRSAATRSLALTHTGALSDEHAFARAFFRANGILQVDVFETLFEMPNLVVGRSPVSRRRLGALTVSGGGAAMVLDGLRSHDVELVPPSDSALARLAERGVRCSAPPLIDLPMGRADGGAYAAALETLLESDHCDIVLAVQGSNAAHLPESVHERVLAVGTPKKPLAVFIGPHADEASRILQRHGIASFRTPEACADAIRAYCEWRTPAVPVAMPDDALAPVAAAIRDLPRGSLNEFESGCLLRALGIEVAPSQVMQAASDTVTIAFPAAAKVLSRAIPHKSDVGGVRLDITSVDALRDAFESLHRNAAAARPGVVPEGIIVQAMQRGVAEVLLGYRRSAEVGPIVMLGLGGAMAELSAVRIVRCAPVDVTTARAMIDEMPALHRLLGGYRNRAAGDIDALADAIHKLSLLALVDDPKIIEAEINPLIVKATGVVAVDALARLADGSG